MTDLVRQKQLVAEHLAAFWSDAPDETLVAQLAPNFVDHAMPAGTPPGPGPVLAVRKAMSAFPDLQVTVADTVTEGDRVAVRAVWRGTHRGPFQGLAPTGRIVTSRAWSSGACRTDGWRSAGPSSTWPPFSGSCRADLPARGRQPSR
jgi:predicted ester cyclase